MTGDVRPPIPASCAARPTIGGIVTPWVNVQLADGGVDFRARHTATLERCWRENLCQVCGQSTGTPAVLFGGPEQLASGRFDEPPLCLPCAIYTSRACPMVAGRQPFYADRQRLSEGHRGETCATPGCDCGGWTHTDPNTTTQGGKPAHPWYAVHIRPTGYAVLVYRTTIRCTDRGCEHERQVVTGGQLTALPVKVVLVSTPERERVWQPIPPNQWPPIALGWAN